MPLGLFYSCALSPLPWTQWLMNTLSLPSAAEEIGAATWPSGQESMRWRGAGPLAWPGLQHPHTTLRFSAASWEPWGLQFPTFLASTVLSKFLAIESLTQDFLDQRQESPPSMNWPGQAWGWLWPPGKLLEAVHSTAAGGLGDLCRPGTSQFYGVRRLHWPSLIQLSHLNPIIHRFLNPVYLGYLEWFPFLWQNPDWHR